MPLESRLDQKENDEETTTDALLHCSHNIDDWNPMSKFILSTSYPERERDILGFLYAAGVATANKFFVSHQYKKIALLLAIILNTMH